MVFNNEPLTLKLRQNGVNVCLEVDKKWPVSNKFCTEKFNSKWFKIYKFCPVKIPGVQTAHSRTFEETRTTN